MSEKDIKHSWGAENIHQEEYIFLIFNIKV